jgi:hypothetical protein
VTRTSGRQRTLRGLLYPAYGPLVRGQLVGEQYSVSGLVLIDTGASMSAVDRELAEQLELRTHGAAVWHAVSETPDAMAPLCRVRLQLGEDRRLWELDLLAVPNLRHHVQGYTLVALLGWDFLDQCKLEIDGPSRTFQLELPR